MANREGRISESGFKIGVGVLYGTAILAASMRTALRIHSQRRLYLDDAFLLFACVALTAAISILYREIAPLFFAQALWIGDVNPVKWSQSTGINVNTEIHLYQVLHLTHEALVWSAIFSVKFSFLSLFRKIVDRIQSLVLYWRFVAVINLVACAFCVCFSFMECPNADGTLLCAYGSGLTREAAIAVTATALDLATDVLIVSIPVRVLWHVRLRSGQKLGIAVFLSLSIFMIIIACIRIIGFTLFDHEISWNLFWLQVEGSVAVIMVSVTAFRSVFASQRSEARDRQARAWYSSTVAKLRRQKASSENYDLEDLPSIPSATMSGMRTFIRGSQLGSGPEAYDELAGYEPSKSVAGQVMITRDVSWEAEENPDLLAER